MPDPVTPDTSDYSTPSQLQQNYLYAKAMREQGMGVIPGAAVSPFQGLAGIMGTLAGNRLMNQTAQQERAARTAGYNNQATAAGEDQDQSQPQPQGSGPLSAAPPSNLNAQGYSDPISRYAAVTSSQESGGNYGALGPVTKNPVTGQPDRAYGKYGVMGNNVPQWTQEVTGQSMTPEQFLQNPEAQEAVYRTKFGQLAQKYGPDGAAKAWFAGEHGMNHPGASDINGMTVAKYGQNFDQALGFNGGPANAPQTGGGAPPAPGTQGSMALALSRPAPTAGGLPTPNMAPAMIGGGGSQPVGTLPSRPRVSRQQFIATMSNPFVSDADKQSTKDMYYSQNQPLLTQGPYGTMVATDPRHPTNQYVMPGAPHWGDTKAGDVSLPNPQVLMPPNSSVGPPQIVNLRPQGAAPPAAAPAQAAGPGAAGPGAAGMPHDLIPPKAPQFANEEGGAASQAGLPDVITKGPEAVQAGQAASPQSGIMGAKPPYSFASQGTPPAQGTPQVPGGQQVAQQAAPDLNSMSPGELANWSQQRGIQTEAANEFNKADIAGYNKDYTNYQTIGQKAINATQSLALAQQLIHDPGFTQGPGSDYKLFLQKAKTLFGDKGAEANVALNQAFDKTTAGNILGDMRSQLQGLGQVRVAEIQLLNRASASQYNTMGANQAILDIAQKSQQQLMEIGKLTNWYRQGYRWGDDGKLVTGPNGQPVRTNERPTSVGQNEVVRTYLTNNPMLSPDQIQHYNNLFDVDGKTKTGGAVGAPDEPPPGYVKKGTSAPAPKGGPLSVAPPGAQAQPEIPM
jgi:hypothetical protein